MRSISAFASTLICSLALICLLTATVRSQSPTPSPSPSPSPAPSLEKNFLRNIAHDQVGLWTAPFHFSKDETHVAIPLGLATAALIATDRASANELGENGGSISRLRISHAISHLGGIYSTAGIATAFYVSGLATHNWRARETGILGGEALIDTSIIVAALKLATQRPRPTVPDPKDDFFDGGSSFPSGHAANTWALATVIAHEYHDHKAVQIAAYGLASAVSISRYTGRNHFLSDVLIGGVSGFAIGRYVYKKHHVELSDGGSGPAKKRSSLLPLASPLYSAKERLYGVSLVWNK